MKNAFPCLLIIVLTTATSCTYNKTVRESKKDSAQPQETGSVPQSRANDTTTRPTESSTSVSEAWLLVPGQSAGLTRINQNAEEVYKRLGPPDGGDAAMQKAVSIWYTSHDSTNHSVAIYTAREPGQDPVARIEQIRITSPSFQTAEGIHTGSTLKEIEAAYPVQKTETYTDDGTQYRVMDSKKGIAFEIGPDGSCVAIIIHKAGELNGGSTYLKFRTTNKFVAGKKG